MKLMIDNCYHLPLLLGSSYRSMFAFIRPFFYRAVAPMVQYKIPSFRSYQVSMEELLDSSLNAKGTEDSIRRRKGGDISAEI